MDVGDKNRHSPAPQEDDVRASSGAARPNTAPGRSVLTDHVIRLKNARQVAFDDTTAMEDGDALGFGKRRVSGQRQLSSSGPLTPTSLREESGDDMILRLSNEFHQLIEPDWDTVVYIGPPTQEHRQDDHEYEYIKQHFAKPYLMNSQTLKNLGSTKFNKFLGPMSVRSERKLKKLGIHKLLPQDRVPQYYIDLRPMQDEDEALLMMSELACTPGVLSWHTSPLASGVPRTSICGRDDLNMTSKPHARYWKDEIDMMEANEDKNGGVIETSDESADAGDSRINLEPEYSTIRHYMSIERVLHALAGNNPKLNSAPKLWTFFSIARFLDCAADPKITMWIFDWLLSNNNSNFIQANPEISYRIAMGIKSPDILRATFAMLVGERALMHAGRMSAGPIIMKPGVNQISAHGRAVCHLDDDEVNRIDHAALSLIKRMNALFDSIANHPLQTKYKCSELAKFEFVRQKYLDKDVVDPVYNLLHDYVRGEIYAALSQNVQEGDLLRLYRTRGLQEYGWLRRSKRFAEAYNRMPLQQRLLTLSFWAQLENYGLYQESEKTAAWSFSHSLEGLDQLAPDYSDEIGGVHKNLLCDTIENMNRSIDLNTQWVLEHTSMWNDRVQHGDNGFGPVNLQSIHGKIPQPDQELVRAMQSLGMEEEVNLPGFLPRPWTGESFDTHYPYAAVADHHNRRCGVLYVKPACLLAQHSLNMRSTIMREVITPGYTDNEMGVESDISISHMDILLCLNDEEWKYLPLWAEGFDDGSGGVFAELDVPDSAEGFRGGAMGLRDGLEREGSVGGSFSMGDDSEDYDEVMTDEGVSTIGKASRLATDGTTSAGGSTVMSLDE